MDSLSIIIFGILFQFRNNKYCVKISEEKGESKMLFPDYNQTTVVYHVAPITDFKKIINEGIKYDDKKTYKSKYLSFHKHIDSLKSEAVPSWVIREKAIFASMNFSKGHCWHSHSVIMALRIDPEKCWIANENLANKIYEPFILKGIPGYEAAGKYLRDEGTKLINKYWHTSLSFLDNLKARKDKIKGYDAEVMIFYKVEPQDITPLFIVSDHVMMPVQRWKEFFQGFQ